MSLPEDLEPENIKECLAKYGADSLSIQELLAVLLFPGYKEDQGNRIESYCEEMHPRITSKDDVVQLCLCGAILGIEVLDHNITGFSDHVSLRERGLI